MTLVELAIKFRSIIEKAMQNLDDKTASEAPQLHRTLLEDGALVTAGTRINWNGIVKKATVDLWDTAENNPNNAPILWEDISYKDGIRIIPETITVTTAFAKDECGWWGEKMYKSLLEANVYTPDQYAAGWELVESL